MARRFDRPVSIFVGLGFPRDIETVFEAFTVLTEWTGGRGSDYVQASTSCRQALAGRIDPGQARDDFETFARNRGILAPDALASAAVRPAQDWQPAP